MTLLIWLTRLFEIVGAGPFYRFMAAEWHRLPNLRETLAGKRIMHETWKKGSRDVRYYFLANLLRIVTYIPIVLYVDWKRHPETIVVLGLLMTFHVISMVTEIYKGLILLLLEKRHQIDAEWDPNKMPDIEPPRTTGYFAPLKFESKAGYTRIGMEQFRLRVVLFVDSLSGGPATERGSRKGLYNFVNDTIAAERVHLIAATLGIIMMFPFSGGMLLYTGLLVALDLYLALLQRYHRTRVWEALRLPRQ